MPVGCWWCFVAGVEHLFASLHTFLLVSVVVSGSGVVGGGAWRVCLPSLGVPTLPGLFCSPVIDYRKHVLLREVIADLMQSDDQLVLYLVAPPPHTGSRYPPSILKGSCAFYIASCIGWPSLVSVVGHGHGFYCVHAHWSGGTLGRWLGVTASHTSCKAY
jgi:hypothetical protein